MTKRPSLRVALLWNIARGIAYLPYGVYGAISHLVYWCWRLVARKQQEVLFTNLLHIWQLPRHSVFAQRFAKQVIITQNLVFFDNLRAVFRPDTLHCEGLAELKTTIETAAQSQRGQVIISAHLGAWELLATVIAKTTTIPLWSLAKPSHSAWLTELIERLRVSTGYQVIWTGKNKGLTATMEEKLGEGALLGFVMDQKPRGRVGPEVTFFGQLTPFVGGPASMAKQAGCPIISTFCARLGPGHYRVLSKVLVSAEESSAEGTSAEVITLTQRCAAEIERVIRLYPEQWCWTYKRWVF